MLSALSSIAKRPSNTYSITTTAKPTMARKPLELHWETDSYLDEGGRPCITPREEVSIVMTTIGLLSLTPGSYNKVKHLIDRLEPLEERSSSTLCVAGACQDITTIASLALDQSCTALGCSGGKECQCAVHAAAHEMARKAMMETLDIAELQKVIDITSTDTSSGKESSRKRGRRGADECILGLKRVYPMQAMATSCLAGKRCRQYEL